MEVCEEGVFPQSEAIKLGFPSPSQPDVESLDESIQNLELSENEKYEWESVSDKGEAIQIPHFPLRPGEPDCAFYLRTGNCKYGPACRFNHPTRYKSWERSDSQESVKEKEKTHERKEYPEKTIACKLSLCLRWILQYYLTSGGCKYGKACRFSHPREGYGEEEQVELNFLGLPIRPGEKECTFYMRNGSCKFATNCRFHHPDPTAVGGSVSPTRYENGRSFPLQSLVAQWPTNEPLSPYLDASPPYVPVMVSPPHGIPQNPEWNGYRANPMLPHEWSVQSGAAAVSNMNGATSNVNTSTQQQMTILEEFPQRPGELECQYYIKTGKCKYRSACRFHHPKIRNQKSLPCILSPLGLPLRPDQIICNHYSKYGICKYGPSCRFDHPIIPGSSSSSSAASLSGEPPLWDNPVTSIEEATRPVEAPVQLSV